jgi:hypothetical protein
VRIFKNRWFEKFARKQEIGDDVLRGAVERAERGLIDADLGGGVIKQRVAREGEGRSGGYRTIILFRADDRAIFVFGFVKSAQANLTPGDLVNFRKIAKPMLALTNAELDEKIASGSLTEVDDDKNL